MRTQRAMDEWARIRNPAVLPFTVSDTTRILVRVRVRVKVRIRVRVRPG